MFYAKRTNLDQTQAAMSLLEKMATPPQQTALNPAQNTLGQKLGFKVFFLGRFFTLY